MRYQLETSVIDRSHLREVQHTRTIIMAFLMLPFIVFSSPEPKVEGELLVSEGHDPVSIISCQHWSTPLKLLVRFTSNLVRSIVVV